MKKVISILVSFQLVGLMIVSFFLSSCQQDILDDEAKGEALGGFTLTAPSNNTTLSLNAAYPTKEVLIQWGAAQPGVSIKPTYKWVASIKGGDLNTPLLSIPSDNNGNDTHLTLTYKTIDDALKAAGIPDQGQVDLVWAVIADNGSVQVQSTDTYNISITRFGVGLTDFTLYGPKSTTASTELETGGTLKFIWQKTTSTSGAVSYKVLVSDADNPNNKVEFVSDNSGADTVLTLTHDALSDAFLAKGYQAGAPVSLSWTVNATAGSATQPSIYSNSLPVLLIGKPTKLFIVGGSTIVDWSPPDAIGLVYMGDGKFDMYQYITVAGSGFKFLPQKGSYDGDIGKKKGVEGELVSDAEDNLTIPSDGFYRIEVAMNVDKETGTYKVTSTDWGIIGDATLNGWGSSTPMTITSATKGTYTWIVTTELNVGYMKFRANDSWDINLGDDDANGTLEYTGGGNISIATKGNYTITLNLSPTGYTYSLIKN
ncbi:SusF/SusE family outer membrane protein [Solitalea longa]|nr:SusE domain-containing protein [Solitalea longa]